MEFSFGSRHQAPLGAEASAWFAGALFDIRQGRVGDVPIAIERRRGPLVVGMLDRVVDDPEPARVTLEGPLGDLEITCDEIVAFTLIDDEVPIDGSDELRGV